MPMATPEEQREYQRRWIARRRAEWFADKSCLRCGSTADLRLDHRDPATKISHSIWSWSKARRDAELEKCQVLCEPCHRWKQNGCDEYASKLTQADVDVIRASTEHPRVLAERFGVARTTIYEVLARRTWKNS